MAEKRKAQRRDVTAGKGAGKKAPWTLKRIGALAAVIALAGLSVVTLLVAIFGQGEQGARMLRLCLGLVIFIPLFLWVVIWAVGVLTHRHTIASLDALNSNPAERERMENAIRAAQEQEAAQGQAGQPAQRKAAQGGKRSGSRRRRS